MADLIKLVTGADLIDYAETLQYKTNFVGSSLFPARKTKNLLVEAARITANGDLPVMAQVHAYDTEARIGDRPNYEKVKAEKLFIKEKINTSEKIDILLDDNVDNASEDQLKSYIFDDASNMHSRVLTRTEVMNMELLATGKITIDENNYKAEVNYNIPAGNLIDFESWSDPDHSILTDLDTLKSYAKSVGKTITRALTSDKVIGYLKKNKEIKGMFERTLQIPNESAVLRYIYDNYQISFATNDDLYKTSATATGTKRFYPEDKITFFGGDGSLGEGLFGVTPEERKAVGYSEKMNVTLTMWEEKDPVATWTKASAVYLPVVKDIEGLFIVTLK